MSKEASTLYFSDSKPGSPLKAREFPGLAAAKAALATEDESSEAQSRRYSAPISVFQARTRTIHTPRYMDGGSSCGLGT